MTGATAALLLGLSVLGGTAQGADSRLYSVILSNPTPASQGGATKFDITVQSADNQTIANVVLSVPASEHTWPTGITIAEVFGPDAGMCSPTNGTSLSCDFGNIAAFDSRRISILANVARTVPTTSAITFSASAETNNENGSNRQVETGISGPLSVLAFNANGITTFSLTGSVSTAELGTLDAGNLQTTLNLLQNNDGKGNAIVIAESTDATQPNYCVALKLTCQPDFTVVKVNDNSPISPYLETILTANVPKTYNIKKAFVIHVLDNGSIDSGFPLYNSDQTSCSLHPDLVPCADFSITKTNVLTVVVHTLFNGKFNY